MQKIIKPILFILAFALAFISFALTGSGQDVNFYIGCGFSLAGILVFMMSLSPGRDTGAGKGKKPEPPAEKIKGEE